MSINQAAAIVRRRVILDVEFPEAVKTKDDARFVHAERELQRLNRLTGIEDCVTCGKDYDRALKKRSRGGNCPECFARYGHP